MNKNSQPEKTPLLITEDHDVLLAIYSAQSAAQLDFNERKWETVRSASLVILGLLAGVGGIASNDAANSKLVLGLLGGSLWVFGILICWWTNSNLRRESELQYFAEFSMYQIEKLLGAHEKVIDSKRWLPTYEYAFDKKHRSSSFRAEIDAEESKNDPLAAWVNGRIKQHRFLKTVDAFSFILLLICILFGAVLLIIAIFGPQLPVAFDSSVATPALSLTSTP